MRTNEPDKVLRIAALFLKLLIFVVVKPLIKLFCAGRRMMMMVVILLRGCE